MSKTGSESDQAEASFEKFILDFSRENKLVSQILKSNETISRLHEDSLFKTKQKVEETLKVNTEIKERLKEIDAFSAQEEDSLGHLKEGKSQSLQKLTKSENEYKEIYSKTQGLIDTAGKKHKETSEKRRELDKKLMKRRNTLLLYTFITRINWKKTGEISPRSNSVLGYCLKESGLPKPIILSPEEHSTRAKAIWRQLIA